MERLISFLGLVLFTGVAILLSKNRKAIKVRTILTGVALQFVIAFLILKSPLAGHFFAWTGSVCAKLLAFSSKGAGFVFGPIANIDLLGRTFGAENAFVFAVSVTSTIIFIAALVAFLYHIRLMPIIISLLGKIMQKAMAITGAESAVSAANIFYGQTEAPFVIRPYLHKLTHSELFTMMTAGFGTMAVSVFIVYIKFGIHPVHLLAATFMGAPAAVVMAKILMPETEKRANKNDNVKLGNEYQGSNFMDSICQGAGDGMKLSINIMAMLIAVIALIALFNYALLSLGSLVHVEGLSLERIMGYICAPVAWLMGVPGKDILSVGQL
ncbi:MAG: nucleoside transporter C-terminal domain-containing protein, partial [Pseudomonadota bacterium]